MVRLRYFGPFAATRGGEPVTLPTRPCARLLAILGLDPGRPHAREALAQRVWPEADADRAAANLRTALSALRSALGPGVLVADREVVFLEPTAIESDWADARRHLRRTDLETDADRREAALRHFLDLGDGAVLEGWEADWIRPLRVERGRAVSRAAVDLARLRLASGAARAARDLAGRAIRLAPRSEAAVSVAMRAAIAMGEPGEASALFERHRARVDAVSPELIAYAADIRRLPPLAGRAAVPMPVEPSSASPPTPFAAESGTEGDAVYEAYAIGLREDPEATVRLLLASGDVWRRHRDLRRGQRLFGGALEAELSPGTRTRVLVVLASLLYRTADYAECLRVLGEARALRPAEPSPEERARGWRADSIETLVLFDLRRWSEVESLQARLLAELPDDEPIRREVLVNKAGVAWHQSRFAEAHEGYTAVLEALHREDAHAALVRAFTSGNLACLAAAEGDWVAVERHGREARAALTLRVDTIYACIPIALHALGRIANGDAGASADLSVVALEPVRAGARRVTQIVADYVAEGLAFLGHGEAAREVLRAGGELRRSIGHFRSAAEQRCAERVELRARQSLGAPVPPIPSGTEDDHAALATWITERLTS